MPSSAHPALQLLQGGHTIACDPALAAEEEFSRRVRQALARIRVVFQPVVRVDRSEVFGFEALVRSADPWLAGPLELFTASQEAGQVLALERSIRALVAEHIGSLPPDLPVFVNVHPDAWHDPQLVHPAAPLSRFSRRVILETTDATPPEDPTARATAIMAARELGFAISVDDLGAGYRSLCTFAEVAPDIVKFDMALIRDVERTPLHAELLRSMIRTCHELQILPAAVGVETEAERVCLAELGCALMQGFRFARPSWPLAEIDW